MPANDDEEEEEEEEEEGGRGWMIQWTRGPEGEDFWHWGRRGGSMGTKRAASGTR